MNVRYAPEVFDQPTLERAKEIILTPEQGLSSEQRWLAETDWLMERIGFLDGPVLDYGCGAGRMSKPLVWPAIGVDGSPMMRRHAEAYVKRNNFCACSPECFKVMVDAGMRFGGGMAIWVLQHIVEAGQTIELIAQSMRPGALFFVVDTGKRYIPMKGPTGETFWASDGVCVSSHLERWFDADIRQEMPTGLCAPGSMLTSWTRKS